MAFIKGPVCRGQLALNVINDRFWVFFLDPEKADLPEVNELYRSQVDNLKLPAEQENTVLPLSNWYVIRYNKAVISKQNLNLLINGLKMVRTLPRTLFGMERAQTQMPH